MPSFEIKSLRNRKRTRSRLYISSTSPSPSTSTPTPISLHPLNTTTTATTGRDPNSSSSDERNNKSPQSSTSSLFDDDNWKRVVRIGQRDGLRDTVWWGYFLLITTWIVFILGIGGSCGVWEWSLKPIRSNTKRVRLRVILGTDGRSLKVMRHWG